MPSPLAIRIVAILVSLVFTIASWGSTGNPDAGFLRFFSLAVFAATLAFTFWEKWVWKTRAAQLIATVPTNVNGTWRCTLTSSWVDPVTGRGIEPKKVYLVVRQDFSSATITLISNESRSRSSLARCVREDGSWVLHYIYTNEPGFSARDRSPIHHGSGVVQVIGRPSSRLLGHYWTDRQTRGDLVSDDYSKRHAEDYASASDLFN
jgi:hypothetical protein